MKMLIPSSIKSRNTYIIPLILIIYSGLIFFGVYHHEPWRDEAYVWLKAREYPITQIVRDMQYEGTPILWTAIVLPFAKLRLPYVTMNLIHAALAIITAALLLLASPFPLVMSLLILFGYHFSFEYAVIARNYVLTGLLLFLLAVFYPGRKEKPLRFAVILGLLFQSNTYNLAVAGIMTVLFVKEYLFSRQKTFRQSVAVIIITIFAIFTAWTLTPKQMKSSDTFRPGNPNWEIITVLRQSVLPEIRYAGFGLFADPRIQNLLPYLAAGVYAGVFIAIFSKPGIAVLGLVDLGWILTMNLFIHKGGVRHHGMLLVHALFLLWISYRNNTGSIYRNIRTATYILLSGIMAISVVFSLEAFRLDYLYEFSGAKAVAQFISSHRLENTDIATYQGSQTESVLPYFTHLYFWYPETEAKGYFNTSVGGYVNPDLVIDINTAFSRISRRFPPDSIHLLLLLSFPFSDAATFGYREIFHTEANRIGFMENYWLYASSGLKIP